MEKRNVVSRGRTKCSKCSRPIVSGSCPYCAEHRELTKTGQRDTSLKSLADGLTRTWTDVRRH